LIGKEILNRFFSDFEIIDITSYGNGFINDTYLVSTDKKKFILQKVNSKIFNINNLAHNYKHLITAISEHQALGKFFPIFLPDNTGSIHYIDANNYAWRVSEFCENYSTYQISPDTSITERAATAMGEFQLFLTKLNPQDFEDTIPDFHDPKRRMNEFEVALKNANHELKGATETEINFAIENQHIAKEMSEILKHNLLPKRITHNDTKLENFLFDKTTNNTYVIDLDTIMLGSLLFDFGDMVRSITSLAKEDESDISKVMFSMEHFEALCRGYLTPLKTVITQFENDKLLLGTLSIIYIQGIRFLSDYISGSTYYKANYPTHNLIRCRTQFKLLEEILDKHNEIEDKIKSELQ
jgi:N-acetylhexosamine 1-kinase